MLTKKELLDLQFIDARARVIDLAAFLDRLDRHEGEAGIRIEYFHKALAVLQGNHPDRAKAVLEVFSDMTTGLSETAPFQGATGAPVA